MTGAGRLSSDLQPVMARAASLCLSLYRQSNARGQDPNQDPRHPTPPRLPSGMEARRVKTRRKAGFQRQPTARSRRETAINSANACKDI